MHVQTLVGKQLLIEQPRELQDEEKISPCEGLVPLELK